MTKSQKKNSHTTLLKNTHKWFFKYHCSLLVVVILILILYFPITEKFFEQDEWHNIGWQIYTLETYGFTRKILSLFFSFIPITQLYNFLIFYFFGVNNFVQSLVVLLLVISNSFFWYRNVLKITKSQLIAAGSVLFGYFAAVAQQSVTWVNPAFAMQASFLFMNLSIFFLLEYLEKKKLLYLILIFVSAIFAVMSKFNSFFIFILLPILYLLYLPKGTSMKKLFSVGIFFLLLIGGGIGMFLWKLGGITLGEGRFTNSIYQVILNIFYLPTKTISQILFINPSILYDIADWLILKRYNLPLSDQYSQSLVVENLSVLFALILIIFFLAFIKYFSSFLKSILFSASFYFLSFMPYIFDKFSTGTGYMESRYYFPAVFSLGIIVFIVIKKLFETILKLRNTNIKSLLISFLSSIIILYFFMQFIHIQDHLSKSITLTQKRKEILSFMKNSYISPVDNTFILYLEDVNYQNTSSNNITGSYFQTGILYPFLVYSYDTGKISHNFFKDDVLWDLNFQGTKKEDGQTVGIFYNYNDLKNVVGQSDVSINDIYGIRFDYSNLNNNSNYEGNMYDLSYVKYYDITKELREKLMDADE